MNFLLVPTTRQVTQGTLGNSTRNWSVVKYDTCVGKNENTI